MTSGKPVRRGRKAFCQFKNDWRAAMHRVVAFRDAVTTVDEYVTLPEKICLTRHPEGHLAFEKTGVSLMDGKIVIADATAHILPGESGSGKSTLLRATLYSIGYIDGRVGLSEFRGKGRSRANCRVFAKGELGRFHSLIG